MQFTQIPNPYAPLGGPLTYAVEADATTDFDVRIIDNTLTELYGAKRFSNVTSAEFDIAPYLRRALRFTPVAGASHRPLYKSLRPSRSRPSQRRSAISCPRTKNAPHRHYSPPCPSYD